MPGRQDSDRWWLFRRHLALLSSSLPLTTSIFGSEGYACIFDSNPGGITAYATCIDSNQVAGLQVVQQNTSTSTVAIAICPATNVNVGGGCLDSSVTTKLRATLPLSTFGLESWACITDTVSTNLTAYSICLAP